MTIDLVQDLQLVSPTFCKTEETKRNKKINLPSYRQQLYCIYLAYIHRTNEEEHLEPSRKRGSDKINMLR